MLLMDLMEVAGVWQKEVTTIILAPLASLHKLTQGQLVEGTLGLYYPSF